MTKDAAERWSNCSATTGNVRAPQTPLPTIPQRPRDFAGGFSLSIRPGAQRTFVFTDRDSEIETLEILTEQIQGRLEPVDPANPSREWILVVPGPNRS